MHSFGLFFKRPQSLNLFFHFFKFLVFLFGLIFELLDNNKKLINLMFRLVDMIIFFLVDFLDFSFVMRDVTVFGTEFILEFLDMI
jgi:hypothetical protein